MARISSFSLRLIARESRFCVFWIRQTIRNVATAMPVALLIDHLFEKGNTGPVAAHMTTTRPAATNAHVDPSHPEANAANLRKWSCTVLPSIVGLFIYLASIVSPLS